MINNPETSFFQVEPSAQKHNNKIRAFDVHSIFSLGNNIQNYCHYDASRFYDPMIGQDEIIKDESTQLFEPTEKTVAQDQNAGVEMTMTSSVLDPVC